MMRTIVFLLTILLVDTFAFNIPVCIGKDQSNNERIVVRLALEPRSGAYDRPHKGNCNIKMYIFNNTKWPLWIYPKYSFYAENIYSGTKTLLKVVEKHGGGIIAPYQEYIMSASLPAPAMPGTYKLYAILEHSEIVFTNYLEKHGNLKPMSIEERIASEEYGTAMWNGTKVTNIITAEFI